MSSYNPNYEFAVNAPDELLDGTMSPEDARALISSWLAQAEAIPQLELPETDQIDIPPTEVDELDEESYDEEDYSEDEEDWGDPDESAFYSEFLDRHVTRSEVDHAWSQLTQRQKRQTSYATFVQAAYGLDPSVFDEQDDYPDDEALTQEEIDDLLGRDNSNNAPYYG